MKFLLNMSYLYIYRTTKLSNNDSYLYYFYHRTEARETLSANLLPPSPLPISNLDKGKS